MSVTTPAPHSGTPRRVTAAYIAPFAAFVGCLALEWIFPGWLKAIHAARFALVSGLLIALSRPFIPRRASTPLASVIFGAAVFVAWVASDVLWPGYRSHWMLENPVTGRAVSSLPEALRTDAVFIFLRASSSILLVPPLEELFWRGWLMRWLVAKDFTAVRLGTYTARSFWVVAVLFASEHGPYWDVGLAAGIAYNWWLVRTRNLADCILAHATTNACLAVYVLARGQWQYWL